MEMKDCFGDMKNLEVERVDGRWESACDTKPIMECLKCELFDKCFQVTAVGCLQNILMYLEDIGQQVFKGK